MTVLEEYEFHVKIAEEDVRDGDATPWERVVVAFASTIRELQTRVAQLENEKRLASDWECTNCGRINPGTMPYCVCREEHEQ